MKQIRPEPVPVDCKAVPNTCKPLSQLEFSVPARGCWTIVHVGMLVPEAHEIFVCAAACLRGVVLSAAEMNLIGRFSTIAIEESNILNGDMEELIIEGVTDILDRLKQKPKAVLVYSSCVHHFLGSDLKMCYRILRERFPDIDFMDCYMIPTMRKSGLTPDQIMRRQLYSLLRPTKQEEKHALIAGNCFSHGSDSDIALILKRAGWQLHQITECRTYDDYLDMSKCTLCINTLPVAKAGATALAERLGMKHLYLPLSFDTDVIRTCNITLTDFLEDFPDNVQNIYDQNSLEAEAEAALNEALALIGNTPIAIDYTFTPRPLELAKLLILHGFNVITVFTDSFNPEEAAAHQWMLENAPDMEYSPTVSVAMRKYRTTGSEKLLALGQKAAYFKGTPFFVNLVEGGGLYGFAGIKCLAELMIEAFTCPKDTERLIRMKGLGCESCL